MFTTAVFNYTPLAWLGSCESPQPSSHTEPLSQPQECYLHLRDVRLVDRNPLQSYIEGYLNLTHPPTYMRLRCHHCGHEWGYKGKSKYYATCPVCHYKVRIRESSESNPG